MRLVVFSDVHGNKYSFQTFIEQLKMIEYDEVIFCGDVFGYYYYTDEIVKYMMENQFICLLGNHDKMLLDVIDDKYSSEKKESLCLNYGSVYKDPKANLSENVVDYLRSLKPKFTIKDTKIKIGFFHGTPDDPLEGRLYPDTIIHASEQYTQFDYVFLGHTHHKMIRQIDNTKVFNPGSLGQQRDGKGCSYMVFDTKTRECTINIVRYNRSLLIKDIGVFDDGNEKLVEVLFRDRR